MIEMLRWKMDKLKNLEEHLAPHCRLTLGFISLAIFCTKLMEHRLKLEID